MSYAAAERQSLDTGQGWVAATSIRFRVEIGGVGLGLFSTCEGLGAEVKIESVEEGGQNAFVHKLPGRVSFPNIRVTRLVNSHSSAIAELFTLVNGDPASLRSGEIVALGPDGSSIASWVLQRIVLVKWQGPKFDVGSSGPATETLEFAHHGFGPGGGS